ncbi:MAG: 2-amino-4-hydroxy-6-hydroxymethyldihydropteridine diphosphokinase [Aquificaceae bacterium]
MPICYVSFGSNWGDRIVNILKAISLLKNVGKVKSISTVYESEPWGVENQPPFLNGVLKLETHLNPISLLRVLKNIEEQVGRVKRYRWGPREIDLDMILYENYIIMLSFFKVPHPHMMERDFVLFPLVEIDKDLVHPITKEKIKSYTERLENKLKPYCCILLDKA